MTGKDSSVTWQLRHSAQTKLQDIVAQVLNDVSWRRVVVAPEVFERAETCVGLRRVAWPARGVRYVTFSPVDKADNDPQRKVALRGSRTKRRAVPETYRVIGHRNFLKPSPLNDLG